ncbi:MAG: PIN domain-containing protein [Verrucomicrobia bacterium]|nr:PIN domain-containing protein [Verrucomicrobiota bacterium]MDA1045726.1 PIN domain-containing protein [Verrucomicrobiota bacterium]
MVIVDSDVWSEVFRSRAGKASKYFDKLAKLIEDEDVVLLGAIRQEVLSGIKSKEQFDSLKKVLRSFPDVSLPEAIYEMAASFYNICRSNGVPGSYADFLICACSVFYKLEILSNDREYIHYSKHIPIKVCKL